MEPSQAARVGPNEAARASECKIFDPRNKQSVDKVVTDALTQLLGYLAWRDTKAALLLFIRDTDVSATVTKALTVLLKHPNCKRKGKIRNEERYDFIMHTIGDKNREIRLAFLPFLIGGKNPEPGARHQHP